MEWKRRMTEIMEISGMDPPLSGAVPSNPEYEKAFPGIIRPYHGISVKKRRIGIKKKHQASERCRKI